MAVLNPDDIEVGQVITFRTINPYDNIQRVGRVSSVCDYLIASRITDVDTFHQQVQHADPDIGDAKDMHYIILAYSETGDGEYSSLVAIAKEWISASSLELVEEKAYIDFRVYNISTTKASDVLDLLKSTGYTASILE